MDYREDEFLWVEKYRPRKLEDCILPANQKKIFQEMLVKGEIQNMLLCGGAGMGKTTVARALCEELETDYIIINGNSSIIQLYLKLFEIS
jgi:replication-associated recombination protein RarA